MEGGIGIAALLGLGPRTVYEPHTQDELDRTLACYEALRTGHPGKHFVIKLEGTSSHQAVCVYYRSLSVQLLREITETAARFGLLMSSSVQETVSVATGQVIGEAYINIGPDTREKQPDDAAAAAAANLNGADATTLH